MAKNNYDLLKETYLIVGRVEEKLNKIETRVSVLELWRAEIIGKMTVIVGLLSLGFTMLWDSVKKKLNI